MSRLWLGLVTCYDQDEFGVRIGVMVILRLELWLRLGLELGKRVWLSLPKTLTLTHNPNPLNETVENCRCPEQAYEKKLRGPGWVGGLESYLKRV